MHDGPEIEELDPRWPRQVAAEPGATPPRLAEDARLGGSPTTILRSAALVAVLIGLAVAKPWSATRGTPTTPSTGAGTSGVARADVAIEAGPDPAPLTPTPVPTPPPGAVDCGSPDGWRLVTVGWLAGRPSQAQTVVEPAAAASGPADPRIPSLPAGEAPLVGVGACRPGPSSIGDGGPGDPTPVGIASAWRLDGSGAMPIAVAPKGPATPNGPTTAAVGFARLYGPVGVTAGDWPPGRYVVELEASDLRDPAWIGFDLTAPPSPAPPPAAPVP